MSELMSELFSALPAPLRIGAVSYLNTKPLVHRLAELLPEAELVYEVPSRLSTGLAAAEFDVALVPSIELASHPEWTIVSDACIGCRGPVLSVKLAFRVPPAQVRTLALDEGSRTSAVLAQILLHDLHGIRPQLSSLPIGSELNDADADAVLVIGDRAIRTDESCFDQVWDLGDRWCRWAELPFVFAMWVARRGANSAAIAAALATARDEGCRHLAEIAQDQAAAMQLPLSLVDEYLSKNLYFRFGAEQQRGLQLFYERAAALGFISSVPRVKIDDCPVKH
jgi:chorismate dehydratase